MLKYLQHLSPTMVIAIVILLFIVIGSIARRMIKLAIIVILVLLFITFVYPLFSYK